MSHIGEPLGVGYWDGRDTKLPAVHSLSQNFVHANKPKVVNISYRDLSNGHGL